MAQCQRKMARMAIRLSEPESEGRSLCNLVALRHPPEPNPCLAIFALLDTNGLASLRPLARLVLVLVRNLRPWGAIGHST
jgi:hypothetical protein